MNLAFKMRPQTLDEFYGQAHLVGKDGIIRKMIDSKHMYGMILWGPPGTGKTTLAHIIANNIDADLHTLSAVSTGKEDLQKIIKKASENTLFSKKTIVFIDEIHRWNKAQQDALLPHVESGLITLIGATTENPSFEINSALLSRSRIFVLQSLDTKDLEKIIQRALTDKEKGMGEYQKKIDEKAKESLMRLSGGDARIMLNALEIAITSYKDKTITNKHILDVFQTRSAGIYDKKGDEHYNIISAFIKSIRGSDADGALYYLMRMLESGEDPKFIARRMIILASEDIGLADRGALIQANAAFEAVDKIGMPEAQLILAHIVVYLAKAPKSRAIANAVSKAKEVVLNNPNEPVPLHLRNAPTKLMKNIGYAKDYTWTDDYVGPKQKDQSFLPDKLKKEKFID